MPDRCGRWGGRVNAISNGRAHRGADRGSTAVGYSNCTTTANSRACHQANRTGTYISASETWSWQTEIVVHPDGETVGQYTAIVLHDSCAAYIAYHDATNVNLKMTNN